MKLKRLLTGVLSAVMALSVCAMPALAADETTKQVTFDPNKDTGSLTIVKYEQSEEQKNNKQNGDLLGGVTFKAYLLATIKQTEDNGNINLTYEVQAPFKNIVTDDDLNGSAYIDSESKMIDSKKLYDALMLKTDMAAAMANATPYEKKTGTEGEDKGKAVFSSLPLGIYLIEEADAPNQIVTKSASFIVSIPRVDVNGEWQYDVTAEPKNVGVYGGVTLTKTGRVAGDTGVGTGIAGVEFLLEYKNTKNNGSWDAVDLSKYKVEIGTQVKDSTGHVKTDTNGVINIKKLTYGEYRFKEISAVNGYVADTNAVYEFQVTADGTVQVKKDGVYVTDDEGIKVVNEKPDFKKEITKRDGKTSTNNDADYGVGDMVPYTLTVKVPQSIGSMKTFAVTDTITPTQLEYQNDVVVTGSDKNGTAIASDNYKVTYADDGSSFTVDFKPQNQTSLTEAFADQTITIKYTAKLLSGAAITSAGNVNKAELVYSNKTNVTGEETSEDKNMIHDEGVIYTFRTAIKKIDPEGNTLDGVSFVLYKKYDDKTDGTVDKQASKIQFNGEPCNVITGDAAKKYGLAAESQWIEVKSDKTANQGNITASGIPCGEYYWVETETLKGYNLLKDPVKADLTIAYKAIWKTPTEYVNNVMTKHQFEKTENYNDTAMATPITVVNRKGFTLPVTGGFGTLLFSGIGVLLVLAGVCVLFSMKKKNNRT